MRQSILQVAPSFFGGAEDERERERERQRSGVKGDELEDTLLLLAEAVATKDEVRDSKMGDSGMVG